MKRESDDSRKKTLARIKSYAQSVAQKVNSDLISLYFSRKAEKKPLVGLFD